MSLIEQYIARINGEDLTLNEIRIDINNTFTPEQLQNLWQALREHPKIAAQINSITISISNDILVDTIIIPADIKFDNLGSLFIDGFSLDSLIIKNPLPKLTELDISLPLRKLELPENGLQNLENLTLSQVELSFFKLPKTTQKLSKIKLTKVRIYELDLSANEIPALARFMINDRPDSCSIVHRLRLPEKTEQPTELIFVDSRTGHSFISIKNLILSDKADFIIDTLGYTNLTSTKVSEIAQRSYCIKRGFEVPRHLNNLAPLTTEMLQEHFKETLMVPTYFDNAPKSVAPTFIQNVQGLAVNQQKEYLLGHLLLAFQLAAKTGISDISSQAIAPNSPFAAWREPIERMQRWIIEDLTALQEIFGIERFPEMQGNEELVHNLAVLQQFINERPAITQVVEQFDQDIALFYKNAQELLSSDVLHRDASGKFLTKLNAFLNKYGFKENLFEEADFVSHFAKLMDAYDAAREQVGDEKFVHSRAKPA